MAKFTSKIDRAAAEHCGRMARQEGRDRAPCLDAALNDLRRTKYAASVKAVIELGTAFMAGWDAEHITAT